MEVGSWALLSAPSVFALIPLLVFIALCFRGKETVSAIFIGIIVGAILLGLDFKSLAGLFQESLGSSPVLIGIIIMLGAGLGVLMTEAHVTHTLVYWIVKRIGVNTQTKGKITLCVCSLLVCALLGTMGGGNAVIAPILIPIMATLGITPTVVAALLKVCGESALIMAPLSGVTLMTMEVTGLSYTQLLTQAALPYSVVWIAGTWFGCIRAQKRTEGKESYPIEEGVGDASARESTSREILTTVAFLVSFLALVVYGVISKQGTNYAVIVMVILAVVVTLFSGLKIDHAVKSIATGMRNNINALLIGITINILLEIIAIGGGFAALASMLEGLAQAGGPSGVMMAASLIGGFGIEASAVAEIKIIAEMFGDMARTVALPMGGFALSIIMASRFTDNLYPGANFANQMLTARCENTAEVLRALYYGNVPILIFIIGMCFVAPILY